ncbi:outer membrane protein assembly factor BamE [Sphingomonas koreensis]|nr:outer membrane protein assembly factor BamE [Sphingomonas koreensis]
MQGAPRRPCAWESRMRFKSAPTLIGLAAGVAAIGIGGCTPLRSHQGYVIDVDLVNSVQPGVDNRQSVLDTLGTPTFTSQFGGGQWFYLARDSRNFSYNKPKAVNQIALRISFDPQGNVTRIDRTGLDQVVSIDPSKKTTPTLGRKRGFFQDLFGNIGTVGAPGTAPPGGGGGNRDTP